ncbi:MAG: hypothetical protein GVY30_00535 [Chloroflexi bacterium]|nr:hypothetical protein [Chloroflexota bacterium]
MKVKKAMSLTGFLTLMVVILLGLPYTTLGTQAAEGQVVYDDALATGWEDWSYNDITVDYDNTGPVYVGSRSSAVTYNGAWSAVPRKKTSGLEGFKFWNYLNVRFSQRPQWRPGSSGCTGHLWPRGT